MRHRINQDIFTVQLILPAVKNSPSREFLTFKRQKSLNRLLSEDFVHASAAHSTLAFHCAAFAAFAGHCHFLRILHFSFLLTLNAITDCWFRHS